MANPEYVKILEQGVEVWNKWRAEHPFTPRQTPGSFLDLTGIEPHDRFQLPYANLTRVNLSDAKLIHLNLGGADISGSKLINTDLSNSNLMHANLEGSDLQGANLQGTNLYRCLFHHSSLNNADLSFSKLGETIINNSAMNDCVGLDQCRHDFPSTIDNRTMQNSNNLPIEFLRGIGLSDWEIESVKLHRPGLNASEVNDITMKIFDLRTNKLIQHFSCFISYSHEDKDFAVRLYDELQSIGVRCWLDKHQMLPGDDIRDQIDRGINLWDKIILCCSESSLNSPWVNTEIDKALNKETRLWKERGEKVLALIPLNLDNYLFKWKSSRASTLTDRHAEDLVDWHNNEAKLERAIDRIKKALRANDDGRTPAPKSLI